MNVFFKKLNHIKFINLANYFSSRQGFAWLDGENENQKGFSFLVFDPIGFSKGHHQDPYSFIPPINTKASSKTLFFPEWVGYVSYDAYFSYTKKSPKNLNETLVFFYQYDLSIQLNHSTNEILILGKNETKINLIFNEIKNIEPTITKEKKPLFKTTSIQVEARTKHQKAIEKALHEIKEGNVYQINLARKWNIQSPDNHWILWNQMRKLSPVPFGFYFKGPEISILGRSMESFLKIADNQITSSPIKGTIARKGKKDLEEANELKKDEKEKAEHLMIVDLIRNDLGRISKPAQIQVQEFMQVYAFKNLSHLISTISCSPKTNLKTKELFHATFPPGSVTGAPKKTALEFIEEFENDRRHIYCGTYGYVASNGHAQFALAIRTAFVKGNEISYFAGGGLVAASQIEKEIDETELKAKVFLSALNPLQSYDR